MIFQNAMIKVIIFGVNSPVDFASALMDEGNDLQLKKIYLFQLIHFYRLWKALIQYLMIPQTM